MAVTRLDNSRLMCAVSAAAVKGKFCPRNRRVKVDGVAATRLRYRCNSLRISLTLNKKYHMRSRILSA